MPAHFDKPLVEATNQVWLLYYHLHYKYCTLNESKIERCSNSWIIQMLAEPGAFKSDKLFDEI